MPALSFPSPSKLKCISFLPSSLPAKLGQTLERASFFSDGVEAREPPEVLRISIRPLLTACSGEDVQKAFSTLNGAQKDALHRLFIQVMKSLHENIEEEFTYLCQEVQVGETLDTVEQLIEEWNLDTLLGDKADYGDIKKHLTELKKEELYHLIGVAKEAEEKNNLMRAHIAFLKEQQQIQHQSIMDGIAKLEGGTINYKNLLGS